MAEVNAPEKAPEKVAAAESKTITILNQRAGKLILLRDSKGEVCMALSEADQALDAKKRPAPLEVPAGQSFEVSRAVGLELLKHRGLVDASKLAPSLDAELNRLRADLAKAAEENIKLKAANDKLSKDKK